MIVGRCKGSGAIILLIKLSRCCERLADGLNCIWLPSRSFYHKGPLFGKFILEASSSRLAPKEKISHFWVNLFAIGISVFNSSGAMYTESPA